MGYSPWSHKELYTTDQLTHAQDENPSQKILRKVSLGHLV